MSVHRLFLVLALVVAVHTLHAVGQEPGTTVPQGSFVPTWETQKEARTYLMGIPAPRGQIVDRHGAPLAQTRVSYDLAIDFPTPLEMNDEQVLAFSRDLVAKAGRMLDTQFSLDEEDVVKHYKNRGAIPFVFARDLVPSHIELIRSKGPEHLKLLPVYLRFYPNGQLAAHIIGYSGKAGRPSTGPVTSNELLWPGEEGRAGLEQTFDEQLTGKPGQLNIAVNSKGIKTSERVAIPPQPGNNVVTTLDEDIQRICEDVLKENAQRGAIVVIDPNSGDILAMASWPSFNPNTFIPYISTETFKTLQDDPDIPLLPRAFGSAYPAGSTFKVFVGLAALESGVISPTTEFNCPPAYNIGNLTFRNWKKSGAGMLNFAEALEQSCNTWFYQVGIAMGSRPLVEWTGRLGLGERTGIPLKGETAGRIPDNEYMQKVYKRNLMEGDLANMAIGQGDILISPLQMATAMGAIGNGGTLYQTRLVKQVQSGDDHIETAYEVRARDIMNISSSTLAALKEGMVDVVYGGQGTARRARAEGIKVAGKTGTAQWGPKRRERTAAWFAGFAPADVPRYAFAALYEGRPNDNSVHGGTHAAPLIGKMLTGVLELEASRTKKAEPVDAGKTESANAEGGPVPEGEDQLLEDGD